VEPTKINYRVSHVAKRVTVPRSGCLDYFVSSGVDP